MSLIARKTLGDCEIAHGLLKTEKVESQTWRVHWVACLALLRAVGHVLENVDGERDDRHRRAVARAWKRFKADTKSIFWQFISVERNNVLKEYAFGVTPKPRNLQLRSGGKLVLRNGAPLRLRADYFKLSLIGLENTEGRDAILEAIQWWREQLDAIEADLK